MTIDQEESLRGFAAYWRSKGRSPLTLHEYLRHLRLYFAVHPGPLNLIEVTEYTNEALDRSRSQGRYAVRALKAFDKYQSKLTDSTPVLKNLEMPKDATPDPTRTKVASRDDVQAVLDGIERSGDRFARRDHALVSILASTGMRRSEASRMEWQYIDMERGLITIPQTKNGDVRTVRMSPAALESFKRYVPEHERAYVWVNQFGGSLSPAEVSRVIKKRCEASGVLLTAHTFRRGMAMDWLRNSGSETYLRKLCGWKTPSMVQRYTDQVAQEEALDEHQRLYG